MGRIKVARRRKRWWFLLLPPVAALVILGAMNPGNVAQTRPDHPDAGLRTRVYAASLLQLRRAVEAVVPRQKTYGRAWKFLSPSQVPDGARPGTSKFYIEVPVVFFTDDLVVTAQAEPPDAPRVTVNVRSASRVGKGDFGENARHVRQLLRALDAQLAPAS